MIEAKYFRDYKHNYMILQCEQKEMNRNYQYKMLMSGKLQNLLTCSIRHINGQTCYYYDISSKITLENYYKGKKISCTQLRELLQQLGNIYTQLANCFMDETKLVLLPEAIYYDLSEQRYICLYYPDYESDRDNPYEDLMDYLLEHIDTEDKKLTDSMYRIYELSEENCFHIEDALHQLDECGKTEKPTVAATVMQEMQAMVEPDAQAYTQPQEAEGLFIGREEEQTPAKKKSNTFYPVFAGLSACGMAAVMTVYYFFELSSEEMLVLIGCAAAMGACFLICVIAVVRTRKKQRSTKNKTNTLPDENESYDFYGSVQPPVALENVLSRDMDLSMVCPQSKMTDNLRNLSAQTISTAAQYGNTVFLEASDMTEYKLYALDKKNKSHIALEKFPYTVGKMAGCVDCVLSDESVSRIHARFDRQDNHIFITDMNSTNGTYKNGLRMEPQETMEIEPGDEIRFGNLHYCYR